MNTVQVQVLDAALDYLKRGWSIIPIKPGTKAPDDDALNLPKGGLTGKFDSWQTFCQFRPVEAQLRLWFERAPGDGLAVVTGEISGVVVLDADSEGACAIIKAACAGAEVPTVRTSRGLHFYFRHPGFKVTNYGKPFEKFGFDVRCDQAYALLPPSRHESGVTYEWIRLPEDALPELPPVLLEMLRVAGTDQPEGRNPDFDDYGEEDDEDFYDEGDFDDDYGEEDDFDEDLYGDEDFGDEEDDEDSE
jgi:hypothetical protein